MNPFRSHCYDGFKDRRYAALFLTALVTFFGLLILTSITIATASSFGLPKYFPYALPGIGLPAVAWIGKAVRRARSRPRERLPYSPLSRDELRVARSKLVKDQSRNGL